MLCFIYNSDSFPLLLLIATINWEESVTTLVDNVYGSDQSFGSFKAL